MALSFQCYCYNVSLCLVADNTPDQHSLFQIRIFSFISSVCIPFLLLAGIRSWTRFFRKDMWELEFLHVWEDICLVFISEWQAVWIMHFWESISFHPSSNSVDIDPLCIDMEKFKTSLYHPGYWADISDTFKLSNWGEFNKGIIYMQL